MNKKTIVLILSMLFFFTGCADAGLNFIGANEPVHTQHYMMGTTVEQRVYGKSAKKATKEVLDKLNQIESSLTINDSGGEVNKLNEAAGKKSVKLSAETMYVLEKAKRYAQLSNGAFDVTIGPLVKAWGIFTQNPNVPSQGEIKNLLKLVSHRSITLDEETSNAKLEKPGQIVDLGGIAKGYAGDEAIKIYRQHGIKSAYISLGGNVVVLGGKPDGSLWRVGIRNPRAENDSYYIGVVSVSDKAIVTSGDYERNFEKDGIRYHHILDPKTGYPSNSGLISATIVADSSIDADALSTATFVLGLENGMKLVESLEGVDAIFITDSSEIYTTSGLKKSFKFDNESKEFKYVKKR